MCFQALSQKSRKATVGFLMSVRLSAYISVAPIGRIYMKFDTGGFHEKSFEKIQI
jgi:hypothetical protein